MAGQRGEAFGLEMGQKKAQLNALHDVNFDNPDTINQAVQSSVHAGALDQAGALQNLNFTRQMREGIPKFQEELRSALNPQAAQDSAPNPDLSHAQETMSQAKAAADMLLATPLHDRPAAFAQIKQNLVARGVPEEAIDAAGEDLSDEGLKSLSAHYADHAAAMVGQGAVPAPHPSGSWATNLLSRPDILAKIDAMKAAGYDMSGLVTQAQAIALPELQQQATEAHAKGIAAGTAAGKSDYDLIDTEINGVPIKITMAQFKANQDRIPGLGVGLSPEEKARQAAAGTAAGELPLAGPLAKAKASGTAQGNAPYEFDDVPEMDANGMPTGRLVRVSKAQEAVSAGGGGAVGRTLSPAEKAVAEGQAETLNKTVASASDPLQIQRLQAKSQNAQSVIRLADAIKTGTLTEKLSAVNQALNSMGLGNKATKDYATNAELLERALNQDVLEAFQGTKNVRNVREFNLITSTVGHITDPADKLRYQAGLAAALANQQRDYGQFAAKYVSDPRTVKSQAALDQAWTAAHGNDSVFADPIWKGVNLYGKPAVVLDKKPDKNGHLWGYFGLGTPLQQPFQVR